jgi:hypothetical protein
MKTYTAEQLAALAAQIAERAKGKAVRWWMTEEDPTTLNVAAEVTLQSGRTLTAHLRETLDTASAIRARTRRLSTPRL